MATQKYECRACLPSKKIVLTTLLLISMTSVVLLTKFHSPLLQSLTGESTSYVIPSASNTSVYGLGGGLRHISSLLSQNGSSHVLIGNSNSLQNVAYTEKTHFKNDSLKNTVKDGKNLIYLKKDGLKDTAKEVKSLTNLVQEESHSSPKQLFNISESLTKEKEKVETNPSTTQKKDGSENLPLPNMGSLNEEEKPKDSPQNRPPSPQNLPENKKPSSLPVTHGKHRADPGPGKSYVTYNESIVIQCMDSSPFILCSGRPSRSEAERASDAARHKPWKLSVVRSLGWTPKIDFSICPYNNCVDVGSKPSDDTDVVAFGGVGLNEAFPRPPRGQGSDQSWMVMSWESPIHSRATFQQTARSVWSEAFNLTFTYRVDSDVFSPYGKLTFEPQPLETRPNYYEIAQKKTKLVAWFVSNCRTPSRRMEYVRKMQQYIDIDIFGACGTPCPRFQSSCENALIDQYKFYLSFENSICTDYVTEKFFKVFKPNTNVIPVTRGGIDYAKYFPANTFINAADFKSPRHLAEYLKSLGSDTKRFSEMLEEKNMYRWHGGHSLMWCYLCESLNTKGKPRKSVSIKKWWSDGHCHTPHDIL